MAYKRSSGLKTTTPIRDMDVPIYGTRLAEGVHKVQLVHISSSQINNVYTLTFKNDFGESHIERIWKMAPEGGDLSFRYKQLISALTSDPTKLRELAEYLTNDVVGTYLNIKLVLSDGYRIQRTLAGCEAYVNGVLAASAPTIAELKEAMKQQSVSASYLNIHDITRIGEKREQQQSFFNAPTSVTPSAGAGSASEELVRRERKPLPASRKFF